MTLLQISFQFQWDCFSRHSMKKIDHCKFEIINFYHKFHYFCIIFSFLNYASLGSFFGHELSHSVTPRYGDFDQLLEPWNENFLKEYLMKAQCFVSQYSAYYDSTAEQHVSFRNRILIRE